MEDKFYTYIHKRKIDGKVFYVGQGSGKRASWFHGRSKEWNNEASISGVDVEFVEKNISKEKSIELEIEYIDKYGMDNLTNKTLGGDGMFGYVMSEESKAKSKKSKTGFRHSEESKMKMSKSRKGVKKSASHIKNQADSMRGRTFSETHKENLSNALRNIKRDPEWGRKSGEARMMKIRCLNNNKVYDSVRGVASELGLDSGSVSRVANGIFKHTKGFKFEYVG